MPFPAGDAGPGDAPGQASQTRKGCWAEGPDRAGGGCGAPTPTSQKLLTSPQALRTPRPGLRREQADAAAPTRGSQVQTAALTPVSATPGAGPSADHALRALPSSVRRRPLGRRDQSQP